MWRIFPFGSVDDRRARLERTLALGRLSLGLVVMWGLRLDLPTGPGAQGAVTLLASYTVYSVGAALLVAVPAALGPAGLVLQILDTAWTIALIRVEEQSGVFFVSLVFIVVSAAYRWGLRQTLMTGGTAAAFILGRGALGAFGIPAGAAPPPVTLAAVHAVYAVGLAWLIGYLADEQKRARESAALTARVAGVFNLGSLRTAVDTLLRELVEAFHAARAALVVEERTTGRLFVWLLPSARATLELEEPNPDGREAWWFALPPGSNVWLIVRRGRDWAVVGAERTRPIGELRAHVERNLGDARVAVVSELHLGDGWSGRLFLYEARRRTDGWWREWLSRTLPQMGPALYSLYLAGRLRSHVTAMERTRLARELHDGLIQSLVGIQMHVDAVRRQLERAGVRESGELQAIHEKLRAEVLNTRDLMQQLRPIDPRMRDLPHHLASLADRFRRDTGIDTRFVCDLTDVEIPPRSARELVLIVREALVNVRKHSGARHVVLRLTATPERWILSVDDDGRGFDFEGSHSLDDLDAARRGPVVIKERVRVIGGTMMLASAPGHGARLEVSVPRSAP